MLYSQSEQISISQKAKQRGWIVWIPTALFLILSIITLVYYRAQHNVNGWILSALFTIIGGGYCIFMYGVYLGPVLKYKKHLHYMLDGIKRENEGYLKEVSSDILDKDGLDCYSVMINIGDKNDPDEDRLFYFDAFKSMGDLAVGDRVHIESNDRIIASISKLTDTAQ